MSNAGTSKFIRSDFTSQGVGSSRLDSSHTGETKLFRFAEKVDPEKSGETNFVYDSEIARNFDETNVTKARQGVMDILRNAIDKAKSKSVQIREEARKLGYDEGHAEGFQKGEKAAREEFAPLLQTLQDLVQELSKLRGKMYPKVEREMIEMVVGLAKKVIHNELAIREDRIQEMIRLAVQSVLDKETMVIKINPADQGYAESFRPELHQMFSEIKNITFEASPAMERGGCVIETNFGTVDARIKNLDEQIDKILNLAPVALEPDNPEPDNAEPDNPEPDTPEPENE